MIIDSHSHLFDTQYNSSAEGGSASGGDREGVIERMKSARVSTITVGTSYAESVEAVALAEKLDMWATVGQHPTDQVEEVFDIGKYKELANKKVVVGVGECGLDYVQSKFSKLSIEEEKERQRNLFIEHIELAKKVKKPLMIHCRNAYHDLLLMIPDNVRAHIHFFSGDWEVAQKCLDKGFTLSFSGTITFTHQYDEVVKNVPEGMFMIETDAPYVAPASHRGKRNEPAYVLEVAKRVGELRGISAEKAGELASANARRVFGL
ncbi:MAG TPA: TatD family hydrolase [Candidatus Paceibacterota bacterium]